MSRRPISLQVCSGSTSMETGRRKAETSMMDSKRLMAWLTVAALSTTLVAAPKRTPHSPKASNEEPFRSFRMLDAKLTLLAHQQEALNAAFNPAQMGSRSEAANSGRKKFSEASVLWRKRKREVPQSPRQRGSMKGSSPLLFSSKLRRADTERPVVP